MNDTKMKWKVQEGISYFFHEETGKIKATVVECLGSWTTYFSDTRLDSVEFISREKAVEYAELIVGGQS